MNTDIRGGRGKLSINTTHSPSPFRCRGVFLAYHPALSIVYRSSFKFCAFLAVIFFFLPSLPPAIGFPTLGGSKSILPLYIISGGPHGTGVLSFH